MKKAIHLLSVAALLCTALQAVAQQNDTLTIGKTLGGPSVVNEAGKYILYYLMPDGKYKPVVLETRTVAMIPFHGQQLWALIQSYHGEKGTSNDTSYFDGSTLVPIAYRTDIATEGGYKEIVDFGPSVLQRKIIYADSVKSDEKNMPLNYLNSSMEDYIISRLPLQKGYTTIYKTINTGKNYFESFTRITVTGSEVLNFPDHQQIDCWTVEADNGHNKLTFWFSKKEQTFIKRKSGTESKGIFWKTRLY